jgi:hypothetical protein
LNYRALIAFGNQTISPRRVLKLEEIHGFAALPRDRFASYRDAIITLPKITTGGKPQ